jgi:p-aminobenzoyl-glutamate transporter AbgT
VEAINDYLQIHREFVLYFGATGILLLHYFGQSKSIIVITVLLVATSALIFFVLARTHEAFGFADLASVLVLYGAGLFVNVSDVMLMGFSKYLTRKRGENWTKELDYFYLTIGSAGILAALNRVVFLTGRLEGSDVIAPLILATAVVIRFIKTRAEIEGWNR